ncbi:YhfL family protein [Pseudomonas sp. AA27]|uniref:DUF4223 family protein n=1 Tax=unclassified Pseudomonas TaxID=196821 RepID=UPI0019438F64|nr:MULTISPECIES: DUF4223 family protein [unclassified Pseudomonas]MCF1486437.1 YhfL family protein [Pseudomonas sp. AA27]
MKRFVKAAAATVVISAVALLSGCAGQVYNEAKNCSYNYLLHPALSVSKVVGGCGPVGKLSQ